MPQKSSWSKQAAKETKESTVAAAVTEEAKKKPSSALKKTGNEIDEIFSGKKRKKLESEKADEEATERPNKDLKTKSKLKKKKSRTLQEGGFGGTPSRPRKRTEDGLTVYTEEELGIGKGDAGGTPLCPFDCSCCF